MKQVENKRVIGYIRVSSLKQSENGYSLSNQSEEIKKYTQYHNLNLVSIIGDEGISGLNTKREGYEYLKTLIEQKLIDGVVVYSISRLGRSMVESLRLFELMKSNGVELISIKENINSEELMGKLIFNIMSSINEFEVYQLSERLKDCRMMKKEKGLVYNGSIVYGYKRDEKDPDKLIVDEIEMKVVRRMRMMRGRKWSYNRISNKLNEEKILSKKGGSWYSNTVFQTLRYYSENKSKIIH